jgi:hypothetical protein
MRPSKVYEKLGNGDHLTDSEVLDGMTFFNGMMEMLVISGPVFHLAFVEALRVSDRLREMAISRKIL